MAVIRPSTATITTLYTHAIIFVVVATFNFIILNDTFSVHLGYGLALTLLSSVALLLGVTSQDANAGMLRSLLMCVSAMWASVGLYHIVEWYSERNFTDSQTLWAGYGTFLLTYLFFIVGSLYHKDRFTAVLALGMFLSAIFEIATLWRPIRASAAAYYLLLAAVTLYKAADTLVKRFREGESKPKVARGLDSVQSRDILPLGHAMNTLAAAIYAGTVTRIYDHASFEFSWVIVAGVVQMVVSIVAVRRGDIFQGLYFIFHSTFWITNGFNLMVVYITQEDVPLTLVAATVIHFVIFFSIGVVSLTREVYQLPQNLTLCVLCVAILLDDNDSGPFLGAMGWILFVLSLYSLAAHISRVKNSGFKLPLGAKLISADKMANAFLKCCRCCISNIKSISPMSKDSKTLFSTDFTLGYSRYEGFDLAGFALNAVAAVAILWSPEGLWVLPWAIILGGVAQIIVGSICFAKGLSFESCAFFTFGSMWLIWGPARGLGILDNDNSPAIVTGWIGFMAVGLLLLGLSTIISKAWTLLTFFFNLVIVGIILHSVNANGYFVYEIVINILFVIVCMYCFVATALRSVWRKELLPLGKPFIQCSYLHSQGERAFWADGRSASGCKAIADIMNEGGICGIPTDTVYVLVAACKFPKSVERAYNTKKSAGDRPMSMWISKTEQLAAGRPLFGELVWGLMHEIWPSTVSLVVPKGEWLQSLGIGDAEKYIGRPDSIACRMPDNTVTTHLIDQTGPIATTSANPTGEADTTHHLQVIAKLGMENCDGILCSGPSPENMASTVVDCRKLSAEGSLAFFRIGVVPRSQVEAIFNKVKAVVDGTLPPEIGFHDNQGFEMDGDDERRRANNEVEIVDEDNHSTDTNNSTTFRSDTPDNSNDNSNRQSLNASFVDDDDAELIRIQNGGINPEETGNTPATGISGKINKVYESVENKIKRQISLTNQHKRLPEDVSDDQSQNTDSELPVTKSRGSNSPTGNEPYEPMHIAPPVSEPKVKDPYDFNSQLSPNYKLNPLFFEQNTKL